MEKTKLKEIKIDRPSVEFLARDHSAATGLLAVNLQDILAGVPKSRRYRVNVKMYRFEKGKAIKMPAPFKAMEFSPHEFGIVIASFCFCFPSIYTKLKISLKYKIKFKMFEVKRVRNKSVSLDKKD